LFLADRRTIFWCVAELLLIDRYPMSNSVVRVERLGKLYTLGGQQCKALLDSAAGEVKLEGNHSAGRWGLREFWELIEGYEF
jgi:hypothetical protein